MARPTEPREMFSRRLPVALIRRFQRYVASLRPRTNDTAVLEHALAEYLDRHETNRSVNEEE